MSATVLARESAGDAMDFLLDDERCRIVHEPGNNGMAVVSFAGVGFALGGIQVEEFRRSLDGSDFDIYFVIDKQRQWYNGSYDIIVEVINSSLRARSIHTTFTLGNSMGGFGAVLFAGVLCQCRRAVAFSPQSSVHRDRAPFEDRWQEWTSSVADWCVPDAVDHMRDGVDYAFFFGSTEPRDLAHAKRFAAAPGRKFICVVEESAHGVAAYLKRRGALVPLLNSVLSAGPFDEARLAALLGDVRHTLAAVTAR